MNALTNSEIVHFVGFYGSVLHAAMRLKHRQARSGFSCMGTGVNILLLQVHLLSVLSHPTQQHNTMAPLTLSPLVPFTYSQDHSHIKILFSLKHLNATEVTSIDQLDIELQENQIVVRLLDDDAIVLNVDLFGEASTLSSTYKIKDGNLQFKLRKQHESTNWSPIFANGFAYTLSQEFPSNMEDFDLNDLQEITKQDIQLKPQLPPMDGELEPLKDEILTLLTAYENMRRTWLRENQESLKEARDRGLEEMQASENEEDDLAEFAKNLWHEARDAFQEVSKDPEALKETFEKAKRAAEYGCPEAQHFVADAYAADGNYYGVEKDEELANAFFRRAAFQSEHLQALLPLVALEEAASKEDKTRLTAAKVYLLKAAQLGNPTAFFRLGLLMHGEYEREKNTELVHEAIEWWKLALRRGHAPAARNIGSTLQTDLDDKDQAYEYYKLGSEWSEQVHIPQDLVNFKSGSAAGASASDDPDKLLDKVLSEVKRDREASSAQNTVNTTPSTSATTSATTSPTAEVAAAVKRTTTDRTTPTGRGASDIINRLQLSSRGSSSRGSSRRTPTRPFSGESSISPMPQFGNRRSSHMMLDEDEDEEEEVREAGFLWKASTWLSAIALSGGLYYALKSVIVPRSQRPAQQAFPSLGGGGTPAPSFQL